MSSKKRSLILDVRHRRLCGKGFGAYFRGSARRGRAEIHIDLDAIAWACAKHRDLQYKRFFIETLGHEFMHAIEELMGVPFDEDAIGAAILKARGDEAQKRPTEGAQE